MGNEGLWSVAENLSYLFAHFLPCPPAVAEASCQREAPASPRRSSSAGWTGSWPAPSSGSDIYFVCGLCRIQLAVTLLNPPRTEMALHCDADMVRAIVGARQVKFLSGPTGSQGQDALA